MRMFDISMMKVEPCTQHQKHTFQSRKSSKANYLIPGLCRPCTPRGAKFEGLAPAETGGFTGVIVRALFAAEEE